MAEYKSYWTFRRRVNASVEKQCLAIALERQEISQLNQGEIVVTDDIDSDDLPIFDRASDVVVDINAHHVDNTCNSNDMLDEDIMIEANDHQGLLFTQEIFEQMEPQEPGLNQGSIRGRQNLTSDDDHNENMYDYNDDSSSERLPSDDDSEIELDIPEPTETMITELNEWAVRFQIPHTALSSLLNLLRVYHPDLPKDPRTLLRTEKKYTVKFMPFCCSMPRISLLLFVT